MIEKIDKYGILLSLSDTTELYINIGDVLRNDIDIANCSFNNKALINSIEILKELSFIVKDGNEYRKEICIDVSLFQSEFKNRFLSYYQAQIVNLFIGITQYDTCEKEIYVMRNSIPLQYAGMLMILNELNEIAFVDAYKVRLNKTIKDMVLRHSKTKSVSLEELEKRLIKEKELGAEAELFVLEYEKNKLIRDGINFEPMQISLIDVNAGFDILSYFSNEMEDEKYIEVKSCDNNYKFYFSENELLMAKCKRERYYIYLYNRYERRVREIKDPYTLFFENKDNHWAVEPDGYRIHEI